MLIGRMLALFAALASTGNPIAAQALRDAGWSPWQVSGARSAIGFLLLAVWVRRDLFLAKPMAGSVALIAIVNAIGTTAYPYAAMHASIGTAVSLLYLGPIWVTLYQRLCGVPERFDLPASLMVACGVSLVVGVGATGDTWQGVVAGIVASMTQATYVVMSSRVTKVIPPLVLGCWGMLGGALAFGWTIIFAPWAAPGAFGSAIWIGTVGGAFYFACSMYAFQRIGVETRMWLPFDLVFVWAYQTFIQGKPMGISVLGAALIFAAALLLAWGRRLPKIVAIQPPR